MRSNGEEGIQFLHEKKLYSLQNRVIHCYMWMFIDFFLHDLFIFAITALDF